MHVDDLGRVASDAGSTPAASTFFTGSWTHRADGGVAASVAYEEYAALLAPSPRPDVPQAPVKKERLG